MVRRYSDGPFTIPKGYEGITINQEASKRYETIEDYLKEHNYALTADLVDYGFTTEQIVESVNLGGGINYAHWPKKRKDQEGPQQTDLFWLTNQSDAMHALAQQAAWFCQNRPKECPVIIDVSSITSVDPEETELPLIGLIYARELGLIEEFETEHGVMYE